MIFLIKWGDLEALLRKRITIEQPTQSPPFYYEELTPDGFIDLYAYVVREGYTLCAKITLPAEEIRDVKMQLIPNAIELLERPNKNTFVTKQV